MGLSGKIPRYVRKQRQSRLRPPRFYGDLVSLPLLCFGQKTNFRFRKRALIGNDHETIRVDVRRDCRSHRFAQVATTTPVPRSPRQTSDRRNRRDSQRKRPNGATFARTHCDTRATVFPRFITMTGASRALHLALAGRCRSLTRIRAGAAPTTVAGADMKSKRIIRRRSAGWPSTGPSRRPPWSLPADSNSQESPAAPNGFPPPAKAGCTA